MNQKAPVIRMCVVTRTNKEKKDLFRVCSINKEVYFDKDQNMGHKGAYISKDLKSIKIAHDKHLLSKALKCEVNDDIYIALIEELSKEKRD